MTSSKKAHDGEDDVSAIFFTSVCVLCVLIFFFVSFMFFSLYAFFMTTMTTTTVVPNAATEIPTM